jgi:hypothetical protein
MPFSQEVPTAHPAPGNLTVDSGGGVFNDKAAGLASAGGVIRAHSAPLGGGSACRRAEPVGADLLQHP